MLLQSAKTKKMARGHFSGKLKNLLIITRFAAKRKAVVSTEVFSDGLTRRKQRKGRLKNRNNH
ncbi:hypothetical protein EGS38_09970 [Neisseria chenwenguii]|nr:hypothetical protein EGS38_09970 [Neisseria chenwenguii]